MIVFILGGARSGKTRYAMHLAKTLCDSPVYVATSRVWDDDHAARIARHRSDRGPEWTTVEEERALHRVADAGAVRVVDCVTLWLTNLFVDSDYDAAASELAARTELDRVRATSGLWLIVSNELGLGVHAESAVGRKFADLQGTVNQYIASAAEAVTLLVAGIPVHVKHDAERAAAAAVAAGLLP